MYEAKAWLEKQIQNGNNDAFASNTFGKTKEALEFVNELYALGVDEVLVNLVASNYADEIFIRVEASPLIEIGLLRYLMNKQIDEFSYEPHKKLYRLWWD